MVASGLGNTAHTCINVQVRKQRERPNLSPTQNEGTMPYALMEGGAVYLGEDSLMEQSDYDDHGPPAVPAISNMESEKVFQMEMKKMSLLISIENGVTKMVESIPQHYSNTNNPSTTISNIKSENVLEMEKKETPLLIAAKNGVTEMVERILQQFPVAVHDMNSEKKNVVLLAVENRQPHVYSFLLKLETVREINIFRKMDNNGNSALHLAARLGEHRPWLIPGPALQMQFEIKWYEFVKNSMPQHFFVPYNRMGQTPGDIFSATHSKLVEGAGQWMRSASESCSAVAAIIATVAFATATTVPGGVNPDSGIPTLADQPGFYFFAIASLAALSFSITAVILFLTILTSRYLEKDFSTNLTTKFLLGLTSLFVSIASMLVSFYAGHFFVLADKLKYTAFLVYAIAFLPVTFLAIAHLPLYFDLVWASFCLVPQRNYS